MTRIEQAIRNRTANLGFEVDTVPLKALKALEWNADLALPPHAAELRDTGRVFGTATRRDELRLPTRPSTDIRAAIQTLIGRPTEHLDTEVAAEVGRMQDTLRTLVDTHPRQTSATVRI